MDDRFDGKNGFFAENPSESVPIQDNSSPVTTPIKKTDAAPEKIKVPGEIDDTAVKLPDKSHTTDATAPDQLTRKQKRRLRDRQKLHHKRRLWRAKCKEEGLPILSKSQRLREKNAAKELPLPRKKDDLQSLKNYVWNATSAKNPDRNRVKPIWIMNKGKLTVMYKDITPNPDIVGPDALELIEKIKARKCKAIPDVKQSAVDPTCRARSRSEERSKGNIERPSALDQIRMDYSIEGIGESRSSIYKNVVANNSRRPGNSTSSCSRELSSYGERQLPWPNRFEIGHLNMENAGGKINESCSTFNNAVTNDSRSTENSSRELSSYGDRERQLPWPNRFEIGQLNVENAGVRINDDKYENAVPNDSRRPGNSTSSCSRELSYSYGDRVRQLPWPNRFESGQVHMENAGVRISKCTTSRELSSYGDRERQLPWPNRFENGQLNMKNAGVRINDDKYGNAVANDSRRPGNSTSSCSREFSSYGDRERQLPWPNSFESGQVHMENAGVRISKCTTSRELSSYGDRERQLPWPNRFKSGHLNMENAGGRINDDKYENAVGNVTISHAFNSTGKKAEKQSASCPSEQENDAAYGDEGEEMDISCPSEEENEAVCGDEGVEMYDSEPDQPETAKTAARRSYVTNCRWMAIIPTPYPKRMFTSIEAHLLRKRINTEAMYCPKARFKESKVLPKEGAIVFTCIDFLASVWLRAKVRDLAELSPFKEWNIKTGLAHKLLMTTQLKIITLRDVGSNCAGFLQELGRKNKIKTDTWRLMSINRNPNRKKKRWEVVFQVDSVSMEIIVEKNYTAYMVKDGYRERIRFHPIPRNSNTRPKINRMVGAPVGYKLRKNNSAVAKDAPAPSAASLQASATTSQASPPAGKNDPPPAIRQASPLAPIRYPPPARGQARQDPPPATTSDPTPASWQALPLPPFPMPNLLIAGAAAQDPSSWQNRLLPLPAPPALMQPLLSARKYTGRQAPPSRMDRDMEPAPDEQNPPWPVPFPFPSLFTGWHNSNTVFTPNHFERKIQWTKC